jgi:glyoxylase-like metal-dependent hydrolase (beta-lactamase superfamily II)
MEKGMKQLHKNIYVHTTADGLNVGCVVDDDGAVSIDLPLNVNEALQWRDMIQALTPKPLRTIIFTSVDRVNSDALKALAPNLGPFSLPSIIQDTGFTTLYAALEASQPRMLEPLSPAQLRERAVLPDMTYSESATFTLGLNDPVRIDIASVGGPVPGGSIVTVRDSGVVFAGWLVAGSEPPLLPGANLDPWLASLTGLRRNRKIKVVVPARGADGDHSLVAKTQEYLKVASAGIRRLVRTHKPRESVSGLSAELLEIYSGATDATGRMNAEAMAQRVQDNLGRIYDELLLQAVTEPVSEYQQI